MSISCWHSNISVPVGTSADSGQIIVTAAVYWGFNSELALLLLTFQHRAGVTPYTSSFDLAETCVFDKQSPGPILCGSIARAPLIPKLRGQLAEFLNNLSLAGLRIFSSSTCVGLRYGHLILSLIHIYGIFWKSRNTGLLSSYVSRINIQYNDSANQKVLQGKPISILVDLSVLGKRYNRTD